jgi:hypothetical protein
MMFAAYHYIYQSTIAETQLLNCSLYEMFSTKPTYENRKKTAKFLRLSTLITSAF